MVKKIDIKAKGFSAQLEILIKMKILNAKIKEIPIILVSRKKGYSKFKFFKVAKEYFKTILYLKKIK